LNRVMGNPCGEGMGVGNEKTGEAVGLANWGIGVKDAVVAGTVDTIWQAETETRQHRKKIQMTCFLCIALLFCKILNYGEGIYGVHEVGFMKKPIGDGYRVSRQLDINQPINIMERRHSTKRSILLAIPPLYTMEQLANHKSE
jgi:hypothetical protein